MKLELATYLINSSVATATGATAYVRRTPRGAKLLLLGT